MLLRLSQIFVLLVTLTACSYFQPDIAPNKLIGQTLIATFESGAFPDSTITMQFVSSKDLVWRLSGNLGDVTGSSDYLISMVNPETILVTWRNEQSKVSYVVTMDFEEEQCFLVRIDRRKNLLSEGVIAFE